MESEATRLAAAHAKEMWDLIVLLPFNSSAEVLDFTIASVWGGALLAVEEINANPDVLPGITLNAVPVQMWDYEYDVFFYEGDLGAYAMVALYDAIHKSGRVVGIVGGYYSKSTVFTAEIAGYFKGESPKLVSLFTNYFHATAVAVIIEVDDEMSATIGADLLLAFAAADIEAFPIHLRQASSGGGKYAIQALSLTTYRYVICITQGESITGVLVEANATGLVGPDYVWVSFNTPFELTEDNWRVADGLIVWGDSMSSLSSPEFQHFNASWEAASQVDNLTYTFGDDMPWYTSYCSSDCVHTIAYGLNEVMQANKTITSKMISSGAVGDLLAFEAFANTGAPGVSMNPVKLNDWGDLDIDPMWISVNSSNWMNIIAYDFKMAFAITSETSYFPIFSPTFNGGSIIPPPDRPRTTDAIITPFSPLALAIWVASVVAAVGVVTAFTLRTLDFGAGKGTRRMVWDTHAACVAVGTLAGLGMMWSLVGIPGQTSCQAQAVVPYVAFSVVFG
ncbi:hypothetical protein HK101_002225, partial [Irineochytrium annulatum]